MESGANGTIAWINLGNQIEVSLMKRNSVRDDLYQYALRWGTGDSLAPMNCYWKENLTAENWEEAKRKAITKTKKIISSYLNELNWAMEELNRG
jgi:hypothetical protein